MLELRFNQFRLSASEPFGIFIPVLGSVPPAVHTECGHVRLDRDRLLDRRTRALHAASYEFR